MAITSNEARRIQFAGSADAYSGREVENFRHRVVAALAAYEAAAAATSDQGDAAEMSDVAAAQRIRHHAVALAERMMREVLVASGDPADGVRAWQEAAMLQVVAEEEMEHAREEARRLAQVAHAEHNGILADAAAAAARQRADAEREAETMRQTAAADAESRLAAATAEAQNRLVEAAQEATGAQERAAREIRQLERRLEVLRATAAEAERRFRSLAATAANEVGTLAAIADANAPEGPEQVHVDLTPAGLASLPREAPPTPPPAGGTPPTRNPDESFYQRRLAGLRERLEKSGNLPEE